MTGNSSGYVHGDAPGAALTAVNSKVSAGHLHAGLLHEALVVCDGAPGGQVVCVTDAVQQLLLPVWQRFLPPPPALDGTCVTALGAISHPCGIPVDCDQRCAPLKLPDD